MSFTSLSFHLKVRILRWLTHFLAWLDRRRGRTPPGPSFTRTIHSTFSSKPGTFDIFFYCPPNYHQKIKTGAQFPIVVNFHGGGWTVGHAQHDERFISNLTARGAVVASVNYRLTPEHSYPTPIQDCLDSVLYIWRNAAALGIDPRRTVLNGFSVGGHMAFALLFLLHKHVREGQKEGENDPRIPISGMGTVRGITAFYPPMDLTRSREERALSNPDFVALKKKPAASSKMVGEMFDKAFFWGVRDIPDMREMYISPGLAPEDIVREALPQRISFRLAGLDYLLAEGQAAADRFRALGKEVECRVIDAVPHYWDHTAKTEADRRLRDRVYGEAAAEIEQMWEGLE